MRGHASCYDRHMVTAATALAPAFASLSCGPLLNCLCSSSNKSAQSNVGLWEAQPVQHVQPICKQALIYPCTCRYPCMHACMQAHVCICLAMARIHLRLCLSWRVLACRHREAPCQPAQPISSMVATVVVVVVVINVHQPAAWLPGPLLRSSSHLRH